MMNEPSVRGEDLAKRTRVFAVRIVKLVSALPRSFVGQTFGRQILPSGSSIGAQYREAMRARPNAEFISKIKSALQELEETRYWLELLIDSELVAAPKLAPLQDEASQLTAILVASVKTAKKRGVAKK